MSDVLLCVLVFMILGFSLRERHREGSETEIPLPLAVVDTEKERLIFEKDEQVRFCFSDSFT